MAFQLGEEDMSEMSEMNLIPLIDIMLVLMIIFMVTASVLNPSVPLNLPKTSARVQELPPKIIQISVDKDAGIFWDNEPVSQDELKARLTEQSNMAEQQQATIRLSVDKDSRYETVAQILALAGETNMNKIAFVSE